MRDVLVLSTAFNVRYLQHLTGPRPDQQCRLIDRSVGDGAIVAEQTPAPAPTPTAPSAVVPGQEGAGGLTTAMLAAAPPEQQKQVSHRPPTAHSPMAPALPRSRSLRSMTANPETILDHASHVIGVSAMLPH